MHRALLPLLLLTACTKDGPTDTDVTDEIVWEAPTGDLTCYTSGEAWLEQSVDSELQQVHGAVASVLDFEKDTPVADATITVWYADDATTTADATGTTDSNGEADLQLVACQPVTYLTETDPSLEATRPTYEAHQIFSPPGEGGAIEAVLNSVSETTYNVIPSLLGVSVEPGKGIIAGTAFDCGEEPIENARVQVVDSAGVVQDTVIIKYFVENFPNRDQPDTSADGLWVAVNIPEGEWRVQMLTLSGEEPVVSGETVVQVYPDSINISNIYTGFGSGVKYPTECLAQ